MGPVLARTGDTVIFVVSFVFFFISIDSLQGVGNYGDIDITLVREDVLAFYTLRTFSLKVVSSPTNKKKKVCWFYCVSVPIHCTSRVRKSRGQSTSTTTPPGRTMGCLSMH